MDKITHTHKQKVKNRLPIVLLCGIILAGADGVQQVHAQEGAEVGSETELIITSLTDEASEPQEDITEVLTTGNSLSKEQLAETIALLEAQGVEEANHLQVYGSDIDRYTGNGSTDESQVYSSAYVAFMPSGYGVTVSVVTPSNITEVSAETYANAAITAGGKDLDIKIANVVVPVNGRGALAGIYLALEHAGIEISQADIAIAEKEVDNIETIRVQTGLSDEEVNLMIAGMKRAVAVYIVKGEEITKEVVQTVIHEVETNNGVEFPEETTVLMSDLLINFSKTSAAQDSDLETTLHQYEDTVLETGGKALDGLDSKLNVQDNRSFLQKTGDAVNDFIKGIGDFFARIFG